MNIHKQKASLYSTSAPHTEIHLKSSHYDIIVEENIGETICHMH